MVKKILIGIGIFVGLLAVALVSLVAFLDVNQYKPQIEAAVKDKTKRTLKIDGDLKLSVFPRIALALPKTTLSNLAGDRVSASLDSARVSVALWPLLRREIQVGHVAIDGLTATVERRKDGSTNLDDLIKREAPAQAQPEKSGAPPQFEIGGIELTNADLTFDDRMTGNTTRLSKLFLKTGRLANQSKTPVELDVTFANTKPAANGFLKAKGEADIDLVANAFGAADIAAELKATLDKQPIDATIKASRVATRAAGTAQAIAVEKLDLTAKGVLAGITLESSRVLAPKLEFDPAALSLTVAGLDVSAKGKRGADAFDLNLSAPKLAASRKEASGETLVATVKLAGAQTIDARVQLDGVGGNAQALTVSKLALALTAVAVDAKKNTRRVQAQLAGPVNANLEAQTFAIPKLAGEVSIEDATLPNKGFKFPLDASAKLDLKGQTLVGGVQTKFDETSAAASVDIKGIGGDTPPRIGFEASADKFNLDRYFPPPDPKTAPSSEAGPADTPVDLSAIKDLNLNGELRVGQLQTRNIKANNLRVVLKATGGKLDVAPLSANLYGGAVNATASAFADNRVNVNATLANVMIEPLLKDATGKDVLSGRGNVKLDVRTAGASVSAFKRALDGHASFALKDGAIKGVNLGKIVREGRAKLGLANAGAESARAAAGDQTDFSELTGSLAINNGVATNTDLDGKSPLLRLSGDGKIDLPAGTLDYTARVSVVGTSQGQGGRELEQLRGLTIPVKLSGPFEAMSYSVDWGALAKEALKSKAGEQLKEKLSPQVKEQRDKLKEQLKGLLGR
jgi:AsmA protein